MHKVLADLWRQTEITDGDNLRHDLTLMCGMATGADILAHQWAKYHAVRCLEFTADWTDLSHPDALIRTRADGTKYDAKAGPRRNQKMLDEGQPDLVIAFPGDKGTADMVRKAKKAGVRVYEVAA